MVLNRFGNDISDLQEFTGSVSISGSFGLRGDANVTGSVFVTNDIEVNAISASFLSGSGRDLFDIPLSALAEDAPLIASGAVTASTADNHIYGNILKKVVHFLLEMSNYKVVVYLVVVVGIYLIFQKVH